MHTVNSHSLYYSVVWEGKKIYDMSIDLYGFVWHVDLPSGNTCVLFHFIVLTDCMAVLRYCMLWQIPVQLTSAEEWICSVPRYKFICTVYLSFYPSMFFSLMCRVFYCTCIYVLLLVLFCLRKKKTASIQQPCLYLSRSSHILCTVMLNHVMKHSSMYSGASAASRQSGPTEYRIDMRVIILRNLELCNLH